MPEYLAPGVYVEETSFRSKSIAGVSTTTTGFIGPCGYGPVKTLLEPEIMTSIEEFERTYGSGARLVFQDEGGNPAPMHNYLWHAVRAFFLEGGRRLYIARVFRPLSESDDGCADFAFPPGMDDNHSIAVRARYPGLAGNMRVRFTLRIGGNVLSREKVPAEAALTSPPGSPLSPPGDQYRTTIGALTDYDVVWIAGDMTALESPPGPGVSGGLGEGAFYVARRDLDLVSKRYTWHFERGTGRIDQRVLDSSAGHRIHPVSLSVTVFPTGEGAIPQVWNSALDHEHVLGGHDSLFHVFSDDPQMSTPIVIEGGDNIVTGLDVLKSIFDSDTDIEANLLASLTRPVSEEERSYDIMLANGNDGLRPGAAEYEGKVSPADEKTGFKILEDVEDVSIVAAPGSTAGYEGSYKDDAQSIINLLFAHAAFMRYRIAIIDSGENQSISQVRELRGKLNTKYAALYYPWVRTLDPITRAQISLPPSGFVAGIYARNDTLRAVYKAPANEVVNLALGFERAINKAQQEVLNPEGVNCFRFFEGRGYLLWGARMATDDPEWKYVNLRRYFAYLERSIDIGTQWAVFEPNGPDLWANITRTIEDFLFNEWSNGALLGDKPGKAYFVRCDRSTMTQNDLDNGRMVCLIGVAPLRPAEFVIFRIGQWTGDAQR